MAEVLISPGVLATENDQSQITSQPVQAGAAIIGPTVKGRVNIPTLVTTYSEYVANFGNIFSSGSGGDQYTFLTSISAYNYFQNGGTSLLVTRVASGSFTSATSSISGNAGAAFTLETITPGTIMNSDGSQLSNGALVSGSADNIRWEISSPNTSSGTFSLLVRRGNDTTRQKSVLEVFPNVSLDPKAPNYIAKVVGDQTFTPITEDGESYLQITGSYPNLSRYVRVKEVLLKTPDYLNSDGSVKTQFTASIPIASSGAFGGATGDIFTGTNTTYENIGTRTQGLVAGNYEFAVNLLKNKNEYQYNIITLPGLVYNQATHAAVLDDLIENIESRGDAIIVMDLVGYGSTVGSVTQQANNSTLDTSYAATYWPWVQITEPDTKSLVWAPPSTLIPGVYAFTDQVSEAWFAPAGINRGGLNIVRQTEKKLTQGNKDTLYQNKVNPLATFPGRGVVVYGQKTLQTQASALDRVNVRRLLIELKSFISQVAETLVFEQNTTATRNQFLASVNPYLESVQQRQGLYAFRVVMDDSNNGPDVIDRNQLNGAIYLQPTKTAEFIYLDFNILPTGVEFPS
jgi:hypothetical protein